MMQLRYRSTTFSLLLLVALSPGAHGFTTPPPPLQQQPAAKQAPATVEISLLEGIVAGGLASVGVASLLLAAQPANAVVAPSSGDGRVQIVHTAHAPSSLLQNQATWTLPCGEKALSALASKQVMARSEEAGGSAQL